VSLVRSRVSTLGSFIWSIADQLRGPYRPNQYGNVILPLTILRRLDCIIEPDRETVRELAAKYPTAASPAPADAAPKIGA